jgi:bacillithiol system protein YtxJ
MRRLERLLTPESARAAFAASALAPVFIFKHSTACGLSARAQEEFRAFLASAPEGFGYYQVDVLESREASDRLEDLSGVRHESPQVLLLWDSKCVWDADHGAVRAEALRRQADALRMRLAR